MSALSLKYSQWMVGLRFKMRLSSCKLLCGIGL